MIRLLVNPVAGRGRLRVRLETLKGLAAEAGADVVFSDSGEDVVRLARKAVEDGVDRLVVAGGDGTIHFAVQALAGTRVVLGVLPSGSGNDLARHLGITRDIRAAFAAALNGGTQALDVGRAGERLFTTVAGIGIDGDVVALLERGHTVLRGPLVYPVAVIRALAAFDPPRLRIEHDGGTFEGRVMLMAAANSSRFGGGMCIAPHAAHDDGLLDVVIVREISKARLLAVLPRVYRGSHVGHPAVLTLRTRSLSVTADRIVRLQGDGELLGAAGAAPVGLDVWPGAVRVAGIGSVSL